MRLPGRTQRRLVLSFLLVASLPLVASILLARVAVDYTAGIFYNQKVGVALERSLGVYADLARSMKDAMRARADAIAEREPLRAAAILAHGPSVAQELAPLFGHYPDLVSVEVLTSQGDRIGYRDRGRPLDEAKERSLRVERPLAEREEAPRLVATFAAPRARLDEVDRAAELVTSYKAIEAKRALVDRVVVTVFAVVALATVVLSFFLGRLAARRVTDRLDELGRATGRVAVGDLSVRVAERGDDELTALARAFNRMLGEVEGSRARIDFLQRMGSWQEMARRLAHEIKNPLTPIVLAVEECHRRYPGDEPQFARLLETTVEIVKEEVGTLGRLVTEFSSFARLPRAELSPGDLAAYLRDARARRELLEDGAEADELRRGVSISWDITPEVARVAFDPEMLGRVLANLVSNAVQAIRGRDGEGGRVAVSLREDDDGFTLDVDDDGPGIPREARVRVFDPYVTTKEDGTGLGLAIAKKIVVEHGGVVEASTSPLGGARLRVRLPRLGSPASDAALSHREPA